MFHFWNIGLFQLFVSYKTTQFDSTLILSLKALRKSRTVKLDTFRLMIINELVLFKANQQTNAKYFRNSLYILVIRIH